MLANLTPPPCTEHGPRERDFQRSLPPWPVFGKRSHRPEQRLHLRFAQISGDENNAASAIVARPALQFYRRMGEMSHELHHDRPATAGHIEEAFHSQQIITPQSH